MKPAVEHARALSGVLSRLRRRYGRRAAKTWGDGVSVLVGTILSQNTSDRNSSAAYRQLRREFRSWKQVASAPVEQVERHIRVAGLSRQKAPRIQAILREIRRERGKIDLQFLGEMGAEEAYRYLVNFPGVGPKTANCTLLFAFGKQVFPVDTHIHRIAMRLGILEAGTTADQAHERLGGMIARRNRYEMHVLLIEHGRTTCKAIGPDCAGCVLREMCASRRLGA